MAESDVICNENNFMDNESVNNVGKDVEVVENTNDEEVIITSPPLPQQQELQQQQQEPQQQQQHPASSVTPEESKTITLKDNDGDTIAINDEDIESPTTRHNYIFKCVFCEQILTSNDDPKLLECLHNACGNCITQKILDNHDSGMDRSQVECPHCHLPCEPEKIIDNHFLLEFCNSEESKFAELKCSSCSDDALASSWCEDCREFICDSCVQAHQRLKITKDHTIKPKEDGLNEHQHISNNSPNNLLCSIHPHEKLSLFCENCDRLTCRDCQLIEHREHKYKFTNEIAIEARRYIADMLRDVNYKRTLLNSAMKVIDDRQTLIVDKKQALVKEVTQLVVKLTNTINVRGKQLVAKLTEVCDSKQKTLQEKKHALQQLSKMTDHAIEFTQHALDNGSDMALLYTKKQMTDHLKKIKCKRADIPNPEIPVRIHLAVDKFPELVKVISAIGQIVVDGRIYPSQSVSPSTSIPPHSSPSPGQSRPPQEQSPLNSSQQHHHQQSPNYQTQQPQAFPTNRLPPPPPSYQYSTYLNQTAPLHIDYGPQQKIANNSQPPPIGGLQQQVQRLPTSRPSIRPILPRLTPNSCGINQPPILPRDPNYQQVSSSTHPQRILQDHNNLRGLLQHNNNPVYVQTGPGQYQAVQPQLAQQYQNRFTNHQQLPHQQQQQQPHSQQQTSQPYRQQNPIRVVLPHQQPNRFANLQRPFNAQASGSSGGGGGGAAARWHIPQQTTNYQIGSNFLNNNFNINRSIPLPTINDNFKITLKQQNQLDNNRNLPATVTSTIPKTPSPNHVQIRSDTERNLDKYCEDSVKDLMATIAKLDSNGVQVVAEGRQKTGGSPHIVDSSTGDNGLTNKIKNDTFNGNNNNNNSNNNGKDDPNEDWCAVCMDGGELVCCDKCPKVFHQYCHIPNLSVEENDTWQCLLCTNFADFPENLLNERKEGEMSYRERKIAERLVLELYCQYDPSLPFREVIGPENADYHAIIKRPIALDTIRQKLIWDSPDHYTSMEQLLKDIRLMFKNAYTYNPEDSLVYSDARTLEKFFDEQLEKFLPEYAYEQFDDDDDDDIQPPNKKYRRIISD